MNQTELISSLREEVETNTTLAAENFSALSQNQFNWRTNPESWSIGQCLQHINMTGQHYLKQFEKQMKHGLKASGNVEYSPGFLGNYISKMMTPVASRKYKTLRMFEPHYMVMGKACMDEFLDLQKRFLSFADRFSEYDLRKNKISFTVTPLVKLKTGDAFKICNQHTLRHLNQALAIKRNSEFPAE